MERGRNWVFVVFALLFSQPCLEGSGVRVLFSPASPNVGPFPTDFLTVADPAQKTGLRVNLPLPDCVAQPSSCQEISLVNQLDGFNLRPRIRVRFSSAVNANTLRQGIFIVWLENLTTEEKGVHPDGHVTGVNQVVFDPATNTAYAEPDEILDQHRRYALVVTDSVRDNSGDPVEPDPAFHSCLYQLFRTDYCIKLTAVLNTVSVPGRVVAGSLFTTLSATAWLESARARIQNSPINFRRLSPKNTFRLSGIAAFNLKFQTGANPTVFEDFPIPLFLLLAVMPDVDRISFASFTSPSFLDDRQVIPASPTGAPVELPGKSSEVFFHAFLPRASKPPAGYPVVIFGHGLNDSRFGGPTVMANTFARSGFATVAINAVGHGSGPESTVTFIEVNGATTVLPAGGRSIDLNGDGTIESREGCLLITSVPLGLRDCLRQTSLDLMQLVRAIHSGLDLDGDGSVDLDPDRIYYAGQSLGALYGTLLTAIEPDVRAASLNVGGGSVIDIARWSPAFRSLAREFLASRTPSLLNRGTDFDEDYVLRNQPAKTLAVPGAADIQNVFELTEWAQMPGDPVALAPYLRLSPLPGLTAKPVLWQFARGDRTVPNPQNSDLIRAAGMRESSRLYRHDLAGAVTPGLSENPHAFLADIQSIAGWAVAQAAQQQMAGFFASGGAAIPDVNSSVRSLFLGLNIFETPNPLPEDLGFDAAVVSVSAASYGLTVAPESIVAAGGRYLATRTEVAASFQLPLSLAGTTVRVTDITGTERLAPLFFVSPSQVNYLMPAGTAAGLVTVNIVSGDGVISTGTAQVEAVAPSLFAANANGVGVAAAVAKRVTAGGSQSDELIFRCFAGPGTCVATPLDLGSETDQVFLSLFGTGIRGRSSLSAVTVMIGGENVLVPFAGPQGQFQGLDQVNVGPLPRTLIGRGEVEILLYADGKSANVLSVSIR